MDCVQLFIGYDIPAGHSCEFPDRYGNFLTHISSISNKLPIDVLVGVMQEDFSEQVILDPREIAERYLKTWFFLDLVSSIPLDYIFLIFNQVKEIVLSQEQGLRKINRIFGSRVQELDENFQLLHAGRALRILRLAKLLSLVRLLRISRLVRYVSQWEEVYVSFKKITKVSVKLSNVSSEIYEITFFASEVCNEDLDRQNLDVIYFSS